MFGERERDFIKKIQMINDIIINFYTICTVFICIMCLEHQVSVAYVYIYIDQNANEQNIHYNAIYMVYYTF